MEQLCSFPRCARDRSYNMVNSSSLIDGGNPFDFYVVLDNSAITNWFDRVYSYAKYQPDLDKMLQPRREKLLNNLS